jgi:hypothetical protein
MCWLGQADAKTVWCTSGENFDRNEGEHSCSDLQTKLQTIYHLLRWKIRHHKFITSIHYFRRITPIIR